MRNPVMSPFRSLVRITVALTIGGPAGAQQVVELPLVDQLLSADFPEVYRVGGGGSEWELLTTVTSLSFDASGNLHIADLSGERLEVIVVDPRGREIRGALRRSSLVTRGSTPGRIGSSPEPNGHTG